VRFKGQHAWKAAVVFLLAFPTWVMRAWPDEPLPYEGRRAELVRAKRAREDTPDEEEKKKKKESEAAAKKKALEEKKKKEEEAAAKKKAVEEKKKKEEEDRRIAGLLLRGARELAEHATEDGNSAYLADNASSAHGLGRINERLLKGEVDQMRSFNKRAGVDTADLPTLSHQAHDTPLERAAISLDREFIRRAHELRESGARSLGHQSATPKPVGAFSNLYDCDNRDAFQSSDDRSSQQNPFGWAEKMGPCFEFAKGCCSRDNCRFSHDPRHRFGDRSKVLCKVNGEQPEPPKKRQRVGANGVVVDILAAKEEAARQADEDAELASPLMRGPPVARTCAPAEAAAPKSLELRGPKGGVDKAAAELWVSRKLRVRVVDERGEFRKSHLKKGVVRRVDSSLCRVDIELDGDAGQMVCAVPQGLLETVVSKSCTKVEIVRGPHQGMLGELINRDARCNAAIVRLGRGNNEAEVELPLDDVCEFL